MDIKYKISCFVFLFLIIFISFYAYPQKVSAATNQSNGSTSTLNPNDKYTYLGNVPGTGSSDQNGLQVYLQDTTTNTKYQASYDEYAQLVQSSPQNISGAEMTGEQADILATELSALPPTPAANDGLCWKGVSGGILDIPNCASQLAYLLLWLFSILVGIAGAVLHQVIMYTLVHMADNIKGIGAINVGWAAIRDLCNVFFIFLLLYIAIGTILGLDEHGTKHALVKLIIIAVLINFSLFFTKVMIDASNILALEFYSKINIPNDGGGLGSAIMGAFNLQGVYAGAPTPGIATNAGASVNGLGAQMTKFAAGNNSSFSTFVMGIIFMIIAICVILASCLIFIKRFITLIFLMLSAPAGFAGMIIHSTEHFAEEWWKKLTAEILAAPVFMIIMWLAFTIIQDPYFHQSVNNSGTFSVIFNFTIVCAIFTTALLAVEHLGAAGGEAAYHMYTHTRDQIGGWVGGQTIGRVASTLINKKGEGGDHLRNAAAGVGTFSTDSWAGRMGNRLAKTTIGQKAFRTVVSSADKLGSASFGGHHTSYAEQAHSNEEWMKAAYENMHNRPDILAQAISQAAKGGDYSMDRKSADDLFHHMSDKEKANVMLHMQDEAEAEFKQEHKIGTKGGAPDRDLTDAEKKVAFDAHKGLSRYYRAHGHGRQTPEGQNAVEKLMRGPLDYWDTKLRNALGDPHSPDYIAPGQEEKLGKLLRKMKTPDQILSAYKAMGGDNMGRFVGNTPQANDLRKQIVTVARNRFDSEAAYSAAAKEAVFDKDFKAAIAAGGWGSTDGYALYKTRKELKKDYQKIRTDNATKNAFLAKVEKANAHFKDMVDDLRNNRNNVTIDTILQDYQSEMDREFVDNVKALDSLKGLVDDLANNRNNVTIDTIDQAYEALERVREETTYRYDLSSNGQRSQVLSAGMKADVVRIADLTGDSELSKMKA